VAPRKLFHIASPGLVTDAGTFCASPSGSPSNPLKSDGAVTRDLDPISIDIQRASAGVANFVGISALYQDLMNDVDSHYPDARVLSLRGTHCKQDKRDKL